MNESYDAAIGVRDAIDGLAGHVIGLDVAAKAVAGEVRDLHAGLPTVRELAAVAILARLAETPDWRHDTPDLKATATRRAKVALAYADALADLLEEETDEDGTPAAASADPLPVSGR